MSRLKFEENGHKYTLDGKRLTGVTTIIGIIDKPGLVQWSANMAVDYIKANSDSEKKGIDDFWTYSIKEEKLEEARKAWATKRDKAGDIGTQVHNHIEDYAKSKIKGLEFNPEYQSKQVEKMVGKFIEWAEGNKVKFLLSEQAIYSEKNWYAGTVDLLVEIDDKKYIVDIKTAKDIYYTNYMQMAGYHIALEELGKVKDLEGYIVLNIPKELDKDGNAKFKEGSVTGKEKIEENKKAFLNCVELYRFVNEKTPTYFKPHYKKKGISNNKGRKVITL